MRLSVSIIACTIALVMFGSFTNTILAKHGQTPKWLNGMRDGRNESCCGQHDCVHVESIQVVGEQDNMVLIVVDGNTFQIHAKSLVRVTCDKEPYVCLEKGVTEGNEEKPCAWENGDSTLGIRSSAKCFRCAVVPDCRPLS